MRNKFFVLITAYILLFCAKPKAQLVTHTIPDLQEKAAGFELVKAYKQFYTGTIIGWGSGLVFLIGTDEITNGSNNNGAVLFLVGGLGIIAGTALTVVSYSHIGRAGKILMQRNDMTFGPTNNGIGLSLRF